MERGVARRRLRRAVNPLPSPARRGRGSPRLSKGAEPLQAGNGSTGGRGLGVVGPKPIAEVLMSKVKELWCRLLHDDIAYGGGGAYWCRRCFCKFQVPWQPVPETQTAP